MRGASGFVDVRLHLIPRVNDLPAGAMDHVRRYALIWKIERGKGKTYPAMLIYFLEFVVSDRNTYLMLR